MYLLLLNLAKSVIQSVLITNPRDTDCSITNNHQCIVYKHLMRISITGSFLKWGLIALNRVNNNRALFKVRPRIKIQSMPCPVLYNWSHWLDTLVDCRSLPEAHGFKMYWDLTQNDRLTPVIAPLFGVLWLDIMGIVNVSMLM